MLLLKLQKMKKYLLNFGYEKYVFFSFKFIQHEKNGIFDIKTIFIIIYLYSLKIIKREQ